MRSLDSPVCATPCISAHLDTGIHITHLDTGIHIILWVKSNSLKGQLARKPTPPTSKHNGSLSLFLSDLMSSCLRHPLVY